MVQPPQQEAPSPEPITQETPTKDPQIQTVNQVRQSMGLPNLVLEGHCAVCGEEIAIMINRGSNVCSQRCKESYDKCIERAKANPDAGDQRLHGSASSSSSSDSE